MSEKTDIILQLQTEHNLPDDALLELITCPDCNKELYAAADSVRRQYYGTDVYIRGLIEFTNYCRNNCYYCGIRRDNWRVDRYRLGEGEILECCEQGYRLGFRTFVLQGGEDMHYTDAILCDMIQAIRSRFTDCAITLSVGEKEKESYQAYFDAGADRYLLRHETASPGHYHQLHPDTMRLKHRMQCLYDLKEIGYQVGAGFMVGSPYQRPEHFVADIRFLQSLMPDMIGIGPFIAHESTPFAEKKSGSLSLTLKMLAIIRLLFPYALLPATTALATIHPKGREMGLLAGANVVMPNLSPLSVRTKYDLYPDKIYVGEEAAECLTALKKRINSIGYQITVDRGDVKKKP